MFLFDLYNENFILLVLLSCLLVLTLLHMIKAKDKIHTKMKYKRVSAILKRTRLFTDIV